MVLFFLLLSNLRSWYYDFFSAIQQVHTRFRFHICLHTNRKVQHSCLEDPWKSNKYLGLEWHSIFGLQCVGHILQK